MAGPWCDGTAGGQRQKAQRAVRVKTCSVQNACAIRKMFALTELIGAPNLSESEKILKKLQSGATIRRLSDASFSDKDSLVAWTLQKP